MTDIFYRTLSVGCLLSLSVLGCEGEETDAEPADGSGAAGGSDSTGGKGGSTFGDGGNLSTEDRSALYGDQELVGSCLIAPNATYCREYLSHDDVDDLETWAYGACKGVGTEDTWVEEFWQSGTPCAHGAEAACRYRYWILFIYDGHRLSLEEIGQNCEAEGNTFVTF